MENQRSFFVTQDITCLTIRPTTVEEAKSEELSNRLLQVRQLVHNAAQPMTTILTLAEMMAHRQDLDEDMLEDMNIILEEAYLLKDIFQILRQELHKNDME